MRKFILVFVFVLVGAANAFAQSTTVSGTVTDAGSQAWAGGTYRFSFQPNPQFPTGPYTWTGGTLTMVITGSLDGSGHYSVSIPSNTAISPQGSTWILQVTPNASAPSFSTPRTTITGGTQTLNVTPPAILIPWSNPPGPAISAYADAEIGGTLVPGAEYFNTTTLLTRVWDGTAWHNQGSGAGGTCPGGTSGDMQFTNGSGCVNADAIVPSALAKLNSVSGSMSFQTTSSIGFTATNVNSSVDFSSGSGGSNVNSQGIVGLDGALGINLFADSENIDESATAGTIDRTALFIQDTVADAAAVTPGSVTQRIVTAGPDPILSTDRGNRVAYNSGSAVAVTLPQAGVAVGFSGGFNTRLSNQNTGTVTVTPTVSTINGNATLVISEGQFCFITPSATGTNWAADCGESQMTAGTGITFTRAVHGLTVNATASATPAFSSLTSGTNTGAAMLVGTGASLGVTGSGTIGATTLNGATFAAPGAIGSTTPSTGAFSSLSCGVLNTTACVVTGFGSTSGTATITWPAVAGTVSNPIVMSNGLTTGSSISSGGGVSSAAGSRIFIATRSGFGSAADGRVAFDNNANGANGLTRFTFGTEASGNPAVCLDGTTATINTCDGAGTTANGIFSSATYKTNTNCSSAAAPAVCGSAASGSVVIAAAATTVVVNTTAVTANSQVQLTEDSSLGTKLGVTCNTQSTLVIGSPTVSARTGGTSFTISVPVAPTTNPVCLSYTVFN